MTLQNPMNKNGLSTHELVTLICAHFLILVIFWQGNELRILDHHFGENAPKHSWIVLQILLEDVWRFLLPSLEIRLKDTSTIPFLVLMSHDAWQYNLEKKTNFSGYKLWDEQFNAGNINGCLCMDTFWLKITGWS